MRHGLTSIYFDLFRLACESSLVISLRMMTFAAGGARATSEAQLMTVEKMQAAAIVMLDSAFAAAGVHMIDNRAEAVSVGGCRFWLVGLGDALEGKPDIPGAFAQVADDAPVIALTHEPSLFPRIPARAALTVAGHTHGGQVQLWPRTLFGKEAFDPDSHRLRGAYDVDGRLLFVSPGIGTSIVPMRLGVPPEISRLTLRGASSR